MPYASQDFSYSFTLACLNSESQEVVKLWTVDPKHVSESERNRTASFPSQVSEKKTQ